MCVDGGCVHSRQRPREGHLQHPGASLPSQRGQCLPPSPQTPASPVTPAPRPRARHVCAVPGHTSGVSFLCTVQAHMGTGPGDGASPRALPGCVAAALRRLPPRDPVRQSAPSASSEGLEPGVTGAWAWRAHRERETVRAGVQGRGWGALPRAPPAPLRGRDWPQPRASSSCPWLAVPVGRSGLPIPESWRPEPLLPVGLKAHLLTQRRHCPHLHFLRLRPESPSSAECPF